MTEKAIERSDHAPPWAGRIASLGAPILFIQATIIGNAVIDSVMAGAISQTDLAAVGLGSSVYVSLFVAFFGIVLAVSPIVAQDFGRKAMAEVGATVTQAMWLALALSAAGASVFLFGRELVELTGASVQVVDLVQLYLWGCAVGLPGALVFRVFYATSSAMSAPRMVALINLVAIALKIPLNHLFIKGLPGVLAPMGGAGCAFGSAVTAIVSALLALCLLRWAPVFREVPLRWRSGIDVGKQRALLKLGIPIAFTQVAEVTAFAGMAFLIARLGPQDAAAHQIAANVATTLFMIPFALSLAVSILLGQSIGAGAYADESAVVSSGLKIAAVTALVLMTTLMFLRHDIAAWYTYDINVIEVATDLLFWVAISQLGDAMQVFYIAALRARKCIRAALVVTVVARWGVGLFGGYWLAYGPPRMGVSGFWIAATAGIFAAAIALATFYSLRFGHVGNSADRALV